MGKSAINWGIENLYTWNPVTGCPRNCSYCVVRNRVWPRVKHCFGDHGYNEVIFHENKINEPLDRKKPTTYFVGFYSDIEYWKPEWLYRIFIVINARPQHTFLFLTKNQASYRLYSWPGNCVLGLTITKFTTLEEFNAVAEMTGYERTFLSIEPLLGIIDLPIPDTFEKIIVGAQTGKGAVPVQPEWIASVKANCDPSRLFWKDSIKNIK